MTKYYIWSSDPHGAGQLWIDKIEEMKSRYPEAQCVFGGDYIDAGRYSKETLDYVIKECKENNAIALMGNHEEFLIAFMENDDPSIDYLWLKNKGLMTINSLSGKPSFAQEGLRENHLKHYYDWIKTLPYSFETEHILFVHAGLDWSKEDPIRDTSDSDKVWIREDYIYSKYSNNNKAHPFAHNPTGKVIVSGHTPTSLINGYIEGNASEPVTSKENNILYVCYDDEKARIFTDGGAKAKVNNGGNVICLDSNGMIIDII